MEGNLVPVVLHLTSSLSNYILNSKTGFMLEDIIFVLKVSSSGAL